MSDRNSVGASGVNGPLRSWIEKTSAPAEARATAIREGVRRDVQVLGPEHPWAGTYYFGDGLGANVSLALSPAAGFLFEWHGCLGLYDRNYGQVTVNGARLHLLPELESSHDGFQGLVATLVAIPWGPRRYLVPADKIKDFCNAVNSAREPRTRVHGISSFCAGGMRTKRHQDHRLFPLVHRIACWPARSRRALPPLVPRVSSDEAASSGAPPASRLGPAVPGVSGKG